jgi:hypothetical protein
MATAEQRNGAPLQAESSNEAEPLVTAKRNSKRPPVVINQEGSVVPILPVKTRTPLKSLHHVKNELARLYRSVKAGQLESSEGTKRAYILNTLGNVIEAAELERRLEVLERQHEQQRLLPESKFKGEGV